MMMKRDADDNHLTRIAKLPLWAQQHIRDLERRLAVEQRYREEAEKNRIVLSPYDAPLTVMENWEQAHAFGEQAQAQFNLDERTHMSFRREGGGIYVNASRGITIEPAASNCATIKIRG